MARLLADYERHLVSERDLTPHTVRAYLGDIASLLDHATRLGLADITELDLRSLRSWLARQQTQRPVADHARPPGDRGPGVHRPGWPAPAGFPADVGASLGSPRSRRPLPAVLRADEAAELVRAAAVRADDGSPTGLRDVAMLELLYATGIRVGELVGLDLDDVDRDRDLVRVLGKGRKERSVPFGRPAGRALDDWLGRGPTAPAHGDLRAGPVPRHPGRPDRPACGAHDGAPADRGRARGARTSVRTASGTPRRPTCSRAAPTCGRCRSCSGTPRWRRPSSTPTSRPTGCERRTAKRTHEPEHGVARQRGGGDRLVAPQRQQPHRPGADQPERVEVGVARDPAPVQAGPREAVRPAESSSVPIGAPRATGCPTATEARHRLVGGAGRRRGRRPRRRGRPAGRRRSPSRRARLCTG